MMLPVIQHFFLCLVTKHADGRHPGLPASGGLPLLSCGDSVKEACESYASQVLNCSGIQRINEQRTYSCGVHFQEKWDVRTLNVFKCRGHKLCHNKYDAPTVRVTVRSKKKRRGTSIDVSTFISWNCRSH